MPELRGTTSVKVDVNYYSLSELMKKERELRFGADTFIDNENELWVDDRYGSHYRDTEFKRVLTDEEVKLHEAFRILEKYFYNKNWDK